MVNFDALASPHCIPGYDPSTRLCPREIVSTKLLPVPLAAVTYGIPESQLNQLFKDCDTVVAIKFC